MIAEPEGRFDDFMRDYCRSFGEAAPEMLEYFARIRARYEAQRVATARDAIKQNFLDDTQMARYQLRTHSEEALMADRALVARAAKKAFSSPAAKRRMDDMLVFTEHYILTYRFMKAFADGDDAALKASAAKLLDFRLANQGVLKDFYGMNMGGNWKGLENRIWPKTGLLHQ